MRKIYLFFALLIGISSAAWADSFRPTEGAVYVIKVINNEDRTNNVNIMPLTMPVRPLTVTTFSRLPEKMR